MFFLVTRLLLTVVRANVQRRLFDGKVSFIPSIPSAIIAPKSNQVPLYKRVTFIALICTT